MTQTDNLHLKKPAADDFYNVDDFNENFDAIDAAIAEKASAAHTHTKSDITDFPDLNPFVLVTKAEFEALLKSGQDSHDTYYIITDIDSGTLEEGGLAAISGSNDMNTFLAEVVE